MEVKHTLGNNGLARGLTSCARISDLRHDTIEQAPAIRAAAFKAAPAKTPAAKPAPAKAAAASTALTTAVAAMSLQEVFFSHDFLSQAAGKLS